MATVEPKIKLLMLHGFAQSAPFFQIKTRALTEMLRKTISHSYNVRAENVEFAFLTGPLHLRASDLSGTCADGHQFLDDSDTCAWWQNLDATNHYVGIESSLAALRLLVQQQGPFTGVVGFSQGATLAAMFASWCESDSVPGRSEALREMSKGNDLLLQLLSSPPQRQLEFALCFSGFRGTFSFYHGFYAPEIVTPTIHVLGELDTIISKAISEDLMNSCVEPILIQHQGVHFVPTYVHVLDQISKSLEGIILWAHVSVSYNSPLADSKEYQVTPPLGEHVTLADCRKICSSTSSCTSSEAGSDTGRRSRSRGRHAPRIARRYRLSG